MLTRCTGPHQAPRFSLLEDKLCQSHRSLQNPRLNGNLSTTVTKEIDDRDSFHSIFRMMISFWPLTYYRSVPATKLILRMYQTNTSQKGVNSFKKKELNKVVAGKNLLIQIMLWGDRALLHYPFLISWLNLLTILSVTLESSCPDVSSNAMIWFKARLKCTVTFWRAFWAGRTNSSYFFSKSEFNLLSLWSDPPWHPCKQKDDWYKFFKLRKSNCASSHLPFEDWNHNK